MTKPFLMSFTCPKRQTSAPRKTDLKDLVHKKCFAILSTNVELLESARNRVFIGFDEIPATYQSAQVKYPCRNQFLIARCTLARSFRQLTKSENSLSEVSKLTSMMWRNSKYSFKLYFEYLSILESECYEISKSKNHRSSSHVFSKSRPFEYMKACTSDYAVTPRKTATKWKINRFRVKKPTQKKEMDGACKTSAFNFSHGMITEDLFR